MMRILVCDICHEEINLSEKWSKMEDHNPHSVVEVRTYDLCRSCSPILFSRKSKEEENRQVDAVLRERGIL